MEILSDIASISTLILFIIYFVGRTITIFTVREINYETIKVSKADTCAEEIDEVWNVEDVPYAVLLTSTQGIFTL